MLRSMRAPLVVASLFVVACGSSSNDTTSGQDAGDDAAFDVDASGIDVDPDSGFRGDVRTCEDALKAKSYVGCEYWPTVVANVVWSIFDFAVIVANAGADPADVTVTGPAGFSTNAHVAPGSLQKIYLPWVTQLKGPDSDVCGDVVPITASVKAIKSAYHLVSTKPVTVYQFNALEYKPEGGPAGKDWSSCPGSHAPASCGPEQCFSYSNDASLLLPTSALTGNYRVTGIHGWSRTTGKSVVGSYFAVTGTADGTAVTVKVGSKGTIVAGGTDIAAASAGDVITFNLDAGDVAQVLGAPSADSDLSGSLVEATKPVQVITGAPCIENPIGVKACDHVEESNFPAETLGKHYIVTSPTGPGGNIVGHVVRIYGNVDGTKLTYAGKQPASAPATINAGDVVDLGVVKDDFEVQGDQAFAVGSFMLAGDTVDPTGLRGDPSQSLSTAVEQYRTRYVFLAPDDYLENWADIVVPDGAHVTLDGTTLTTAPSPIAGGYSVMRVQLGAGKLGAHDLRSNIPVGLQVLGYGEYTSYQYPGGSNLTSIAPPPPKIK